MRQALSARGIRLTKSLGQNFLHDGNQLRRIVEAAELTKMDKVLEIGPGLGPLTERLLQSAGEVLAIEKDARLVEVLRERFGTKPAMSQPPEHAGATLASALPARADAMPTLRLLHDDALEYLKREPRDWSQWKLVANLPYSVASPILVELAQAPGRPARMVVTLQLEVAQRLLAQPGDKDYGVLTLLMLLDYVPRAWFKIPASCFFPAPDVDSACVVLARRSETLLADEHRNVFVALVKRAFSQRRKRMLKLLKADWPAADLERAAEQVRLPPGVRAEAVSLMDFVKLTQQLLA